MALKPQSIRKSVTIFLNGREVEKQEVLELSKEWNEKQENLFKRLLKSEGEMTIKGIVIKTVLQEKIVNSFGEKDPKHIIMPGVDDRF
jgi:hypothetical protein